MKARLLGSLALVGFLGLTACGRPAAEPTAPHTFAFGVYGDAPYFLWEQARHGRVLAEIGASDLAFLIHVGDILWHQCSDVRYEAKRKELDAMPLPVVYTPGDNEWTDCHERKAGGYEPLDRLASLRRIFFSRPGRTLGAQGLALTTQAADTAYAGFPENVRWTYGGFLFAAVHIVGSDNGRAPFEGRGGEDNEEVEARTRAAMAWIEAAFDRARADSSRGLFLALHADMSLGSMSSNKNYAPFRELLRSQLQTYANPVYLVHGDSHTFRVDQPLKDAEGRVIENLTRIETFGSPDVGWVRVVVDTLAGRVVHFEPRLTDGWL